MTCDVSPFLAGNYAPVRREIDASALPVAGEIPRDLDGMFLRNGPNPQFDPPGRYHWFDGDGMIHGVRLSGGRASYRNRWVRTRSWELEREAGRALWPGLRGPLRADAPEGILIKHTANTSLAWHAKRLLALMEATAPYEVRAPSLETVGPYDFGGRLRSPFTAHPKVDPATGEMVFFGYQLAPASLTHGVVMPDGRIAHATEVALRFPVMMHDFAVTPRHSLFLDLPLAFDLGRVQAGRFPVVFRGELGARIGVLPRYGVGSQTRWFDVAPCAVFHTAAAWEEGDAVSLVACRMEHTDVLAGPDREPDVPPGDHGRLHRWTLDAATGAVREEPLDDAPVDFPRVNESVGRARYVYAARIEPSRDGALGRFDGVVKYDLATGSSETHAWGRGRHGGEAVFVPRRGARDEDDGYLVTFVWDELEQRSELAVLDARSMASRPLCRVALPQRVPFGFHGLWLDGAELT